MIIPKSVFLPMWTFTNYEVNHFVKKLPWHNLVESEKENIYEIYKFFVDEMNFAFTKE